MNSFLNAPKYMSPTQAANHRGVRLFIFAALAFLALFVMPNLMHASTASDLFSATNANGDANVQQGLNSILWWIYLIFKIIAIVVVGWSMLEIRNGELTKGFFGVLAAIGLFFTPALVELARKLGQAAGAGT